MKSTLTILILFIGLISSGQSNVEKRDPANQQDSEVMLIANNSSIRISKYKYSTINETSLIFKTETDKCNNNQNIVLTLISGEKLNFQNSNILCTKGQTKKYLLEGYFILTPESYKKLSQTEIKEVNLGGTKISVNYLERGENLKELFRLSESF